ncbi:DedA family protein [Baekduia sp. Peel2402]|uniref:DedA family protein n=1 Tax=Baekduia sp. Peel2402 TaxID=3458296 RepID=UPI00403EF108
MPAHLVFASITTTLTDFVGRHGAYAIFIIMAVDAVLPVGGELTMLYAGALAAGAISSHHPVLLGRTLHTGLESYILLALAGTFGYLLGSLVGWAIGRWGGRPLLERHGRWLHLNAANLARAERWFDRRGRAAVFLGRITPLIRSFISIPAGVFETPLVPYTLLTLAGSALWCFAFAGAGWALGDNYDKVHHAFTAVEVLLVAGILIGIGYLIRRRRAATPARG